MRYGRDYERGYRREGRYAGPPRYDQGFRRRGSGRYDRDLRPPSSDLGPTFGSFPRPGPDAERRWGDAGWRASRRFRPGVYGEDYPVLPSGERGRERGGARWEGGRYDREFASNRSRGSELEYGPNLNRRPSERARGYDRDLRSRSPQRGETARAREPFVPERAYARYPELDEPQEQHGADWPGGGVGVAEQPVSSDEELAQAVREKLHRDAYVRAEEIEISVAAGVVTLRGKVADYMEARYVWDDAWEAEGVRGVLNQLTVRTDQPDRESGDETASETE